MEKKCSWLIQLDFFFLICLIGTTHNWKFWDWNSWLFELPGEIANLVHCKT